MSLNTDDYAREASQVARSLEEALHRGAPPGTIDDLVRDFEARAKRVAEKWARERSAYAAGYAWHTGWGESPP